jgi:hypothetical protein
VHIHAFSHQNNTLIYTVRVLFCIPTGEMYIIHV